MIELVLVELFGGLAKCLAYTNDVEVIKGDEVVVETTNGNKVGVVLAICEVERGSDVADIINELNNRATIKPIVVNVTTSAKSSEGVRLGDVY